MGTHSVILHVGPHKTGSTALQRALMGQEKALAERGVGYPVTGRVSFGHHDLVNHLRLWPVAFDEGAFRDELTRHPVTLISSENFVHLDEEALERLKPLLPEGTPVRVVFYLRRLVDLWPSHWQELVKHGHQMDFSDYLGYASFIRPSSRSLAIDQLQQLRLMAKVFGEENITIVGYDHLRAEKMDLAAHFVTEILGFEQDAVFRTQDVNQSKSPWTVELIRALNGIHAELTGKRAAAELRIAALKALDAGQWPVFDDFRALTEATSSPIEINSEGAVVRFLQNRIVNRYQHRFLGDAEAVAAAYNALVRRSVPLFRFPLLGQEEMRQQLLAFYEMLPDPARKSA